MTKGIREFAISAFASTLSQRAELGNVEFRRSVMAQTCAAFEGLSIASAATHYNHALKLAKVETPESVLGLGRAEDKKGGRKPLHTVDVIKVKDGSVVATGLSTAKAEAMIAAASAARKAKLAIKVVEAAVAETPADPEAAATDATTETAAPETPADAAVAA